MQPTWKDAGRELLQTVTNVRLAEYLIDTSTLITMPQDYWPDDGVKWSVNVIDHRASKRHQGGHAFQVLLAESTPAYMADGSDGTYAVELSAKQIRTGIERKYGRGKTLEQIFDTKFVQPTSALAQAALAMTRTMVTGFQKVKNEIRTRNQGKIGRSETQSTYKCAAVASVMASMLCEEEGIEFAGNPAHALYRSLWQKR